jgi:hypothetical protein
VIRYRYSNHLTPPAPFVNVALRNPADGTELLNVPAQVDSAADRSVIPQSLALQLGLAQMGTLAIGGLGGISYSLPTYIVSVGVHDLPPQTIKVVASADEPWMLLGRDVLSAHRLVLDGPGERDVFGRRFRRGRETRADRSLPTGGFRERRPALPAKSQSPRGASSARRHPGADRPGPAQ